MRSLENNVRPVGFFDSGVGGLPYLAHARTAEPQERYVYLADREHFPYGEKSPEAVLSAVLQGMERLVEREDPKAVVIACNTASVIALSELRRRFAPLPFVGVVPAVKPAAEQSRTGVIGVLATQRTINDPYLDDLLQRHAGSRKAVRLAGARIVEFVEQDWFQAGPEARMAVVSQQASEFKAQGADVVVLGCTHFLYVADELHRSLGEGVRVLDSREGVTRQLQRVLNSVGRAQGRTGGTDRLYLTGQTEPEPRYAGFANLFSLELAGCI